MLSKLRSHVRRDADRSRHKLRGPKRYAFGAGLTLAAAVAIALATGWGSAVADSIGKVLVTNTPANPVPVQEQRTDASGNIKVHEQGTANANVTNDAAHPVPVHEQATDANGNLKVHEQGTADVHVTNDLNVGSPAPITRGAGSVSVPSDGTGVSFAQGTTASALQIHMSSDVNYILFHASGTFGGDTAMFLGPGRGEPSDIVLPLNRPIEFETIRCSGDGTGECDVGWAGASP